MPLIKQKKKSELKSVKIALDAELLETIHQYCTFANIESIDEFISQSASYILEHDKDWKKHKKLNKIF